MGNQAERGHINCLDGLRGMAALWVFVSHVLILCGARWMPILSAGHLAVDLFIMLSGFLMAHHYVMRQSKEPWDRLSTWNTFWIRRYFRIAPLYYVLLAVAIGFGAFYGDMRNTVAHVWSATATDVARYSDNSLTNLLAHISFVFGAVPQYAFQTPLPDWSIGLEMQFYLAFPYIMLAIGRWGGFKTGLVIVVLCAVASKVFSEFFGEFEMPSFLPMKMHIFLIGMWLALSRKNQSSRAALILAICMAVAARFYHHESITETAVRVGLVLMLYYLIDGNALPSFGLLTKAVSLVREAFSSRVAEFLGDTSYGFYLLHLLVLLPVAGTLASKPEYLHASELVRFSVCFAITAPIVWFAAWLLYRFVEKPGISVGKAATIKFNAV
jgi:peptidoglycan/LPS O-acetylase OafA/YrhL